MESARERRDPAPRSKSSSGRSHEDVERRQRRSRSPRRRLEGWYLVWVCINKNVFRDEIREARHNLPPRLKSNDDDLSPPRSRPAVDQGRPRERWRDERRGQRSPQGEERSRGDRRGQRSPHGDRRRMDRRERRSPDGKEQRRDERGRGDDRGPRRQEGSGSRGRGHDRRKSDQDPSQYE